MGEYLQLLDGVGLVPVVSISLEEFKSGLVYTNYKIISSQAFYFGQKLGVAAHEGGYINRAGNRVGDVFDLIIGIRVCQFERYWEENQ